MPEVVTIGETMVGFTPADGRPMKAAMEFRRFVGGAESNVAIQLVKLGHTAGWVSRVGDDLFGQMILGEVATHGVDTSRVEVGHGEPTGLYFKDRSDVSDREVVYRREGSAMSRMQPDSLDEEYIGSARLLHITGVTLALSESCRRLVQRAVEIARANGVTISFDPNFRPQLWSREEARRAYHAVLPYVDLLIPTMEEAPLLISGVGQKDEPQTVLEALGRQGFRSIFMKRGAHGAYCWYEGRTASVPPVPIERVVDSVGAGDAFSAGVIAGYLEGLDPVQTTRLANATGAAATTALGDTEGVPERSVLDGMVLRAYGERSVG